MNVEEAIKVLDDAGLVFRIPAGMGRLFPEAKVEINNNGDYAVAVLVMSLD